MKVNCCKRSCDQGEVCVCSLTSLTFFLITLGLAVGGLFLTSHYHDFEFVKKHVNGTAEEDIVDVDKFSKFSAGLAIIVLAFFFMIPATICCVCAVQYAQTNAPIEPDYDLEGGTPDSEEAAYTESPASIANPTTKHVRLSSP